MPGLRSVLRRTALLLVLLAVLTAGVLAAEDAASTASTPEAFFEILEQRIRAQEENFSIAYEGDRTELGIPDKNGLGSTLRTMSARSACSADNADYPALNIADGQMGWLAGAYYFDLEYLATQEEIDEVSRRAAEIVDSFDLSGEDDYTKIKLLYEYIGTHYTYDDTLTKFSAYDGLTTGSMVCQGYALLTYKVMWNAGIPCRIVTGTSSLQNHAWNIVKLNGKWYNLDVTWDAADEIGGIMSWDYFLKSMEEFDGHSRFTPYETDAYHAMHPMAKKSVGLPKVTMVVNGDELVSLIIRAGVEVQLEAILPEGMDSEIQWESSTPDLITVSADGRLMANGLGSTVITASVVGDRGIISAQVSAQSVDLRTASPWAFETVTEYYLNQLLPVSMCSDFQQGITRGELARLCYQFVLHQRGWDAMILKNPYDDIGDSEDALEILRARSVGLMEGTSKTTFSPDRIVTREQAAKVLIRLLEYLEGTPYQGSGEPDYDDAAQVSEWAKPFVSAATEAGLLEGAGGSFRPQQQMTREQMITALYRVLLLCTEQQAAA